MDFWLPNATRMQGAHKGGDLVGGAPRFIHHITWDTLDASGNPPQMVNVANYLISKGYEPHLLIDPVTGAMIQFLPFNTSGYAVSHPANPETNRMGSACIQIEWFFTPGVVRNGKKYQTLAETPMVGWSQILAVGAAFGIPEVWPLGMPQWSGNSRDANTWVSKAGHYGHCHVPENDHTDPGPMPSFASTVIVPTSVIGPVLVHRGNPALVAALQRAVHIAADGKWGNGTDAALQMVAYGAHGLVQNARALQGYVGAVVDGAWGPNSQAALVGTVKKIQAALSVPADGSWGPLTQGAYALARNTNLNQF